MKDLESINDVKTLVDEFYRKVRNDDLLAPVFALRLTGDWQPHLDTMYRFWSAALFRVGEYKGNPFGKHSMLPIDAVHFEQWIKLFYETLDERFTGPVADEAKIRAMIMAHTFCERIEDRRQASKEWNR